MRSLLGRLRRGGLAAASAWGLALELATLVSTVLSFTLPGVVLAVLQHVVRERESLADTARSCLSITLGLGALLTVLGAAGAAVVVDTLTALAVITILLTEFVAAPVLQVAASVVQAESGFAGATRLRLSLVAGRVLVLVALFAGDALTVASLGTAMLAISAVLALRALRVVGGRYEFPFTPGPIRVRHLRTNALHSAAISASALNTDGDKLVLAANDFVVDTGLYAAAYRVVSFGMVPVGSVVAATHRRFLEHEEGVARQHLDRALRFGLGAAAYGVVAGAGLVLVAPALPLVMGEEFEDSVVMVRWLAPTILLRSLTIFSLNGLMGLGKTGLRTVVIAANAVLAMALYLVLVPSRGWEGAAIGTLVSEAVAVVATWWALILCQLRADRALAGPVDALELRRVRAE
jgi:O-antigen/teichoic acid export membrane protein